jgi:hypothetical protein
MPQILPRFRSVRPFWNPVEGRYFQYRRPEEIAAVCTRCSARLAFKADPTKTHEFDEKTGGYLVLKGEVEGTVTGRGSCGNCGKIVRSLDWPRDAFFKVRLAQGLVWAWSEQYLPALRARVAGDQTRLRHLTLNRGDLARFVARVPRYALLVKNRARVLTGLDQLERG